MTKDEALDLALEALEGSGDKTLSIRAITAIKQALAAPTVQEPLTWLKTIETLGGFGKFVEAKPNEKGAKPVYLARPAQPAPVQEPEIVQRVKRYAGQTMRTARNPNITARECIELAALKAQPAPAHYTAGLEHCNAALEEALIRLQKQYDQLKAKEAAQPAPVQPVACKTLCELCVKRGYAFCANAAKTTPINLPAAQPAPVQLVGWMTQARNFVHVMEFTEAEAKLYGWIPVYTAPPAAQRQWVGLTDEEENALIPDPDGSAEANVRRVEVLPGTWGKEYEEVDAWSKPLVLQMLRDHEAKLKEKNNG
jgi:hypothetical protein